MTAPSRLVPFPAPGAAALVYVAHPTVGGDLASTVSFHAARWLLAPGPSEGTARETAARALFSMTRSPLPPELDLGRPYRGIRLELGPLGEPTVVLRPADDDGPSLALDALLRAAARDVHG